MRKLKRKSKSLKWNPISIFEIKMLCVILGLLAASISSCGQDTLKTTESVPFCLQKPKTRVYEQPIDLGNGTAKYKGSLYPINVGPKGGFFLLVDGKKVYLSKTEKK